MDDTWKSIPLFAEHGYNQTCSHARTANYWEIYQLSVIGLYFYLSKRASEFQEILIISSLEANSHYSLNIFSSFIIRDENR